TAADLLSLKRSQEGDELLARHPDRLRSVLLDADVNDPDTQELAGLLPDVTLAALEREAAQALQGGPTDDWRSPWKLLKLSWVARPERARDSLARILPPPPVAPGLRLQLLRELAEIGLPEAQRHHPQALLRGCSAEELREMADADLPPAWLV